MYCPLCATPHTDGAKFCRSCGTELEAVALVLSGKPARAAETGDASEPKSISDLLEKRIEGVKHVTAGMTLLAVSLLIGVALALSLPSSFEVPWILIWTVFFGWMAVWGGIELANGIGSMLESKSRLRIMNTADKQIATESTTQQLSSADDTHLITNSAAAFRSSPAHSVTEETTRRLEDMKRMTNPELRP